MFDLTIVAAFVAWAVYSGFRNKRRASVDLREYFLAGHTLKGWQAGISMAATQFAADTPLLVTGLIAAGGIYLNWRLWIYGLAFLMMGFLFARCWRRTDVLTDAELTDVRYSGRATTLLRAFKAVYYGTVFNCVVLAMVLVAALRIAEMFLPWHDWLPAGLFAAIRDATVAAGFDFGTSITGLDAATHAADSLLSIVALVSFTLLYSTTGGLRSVVATDIGQFALAMTGTLAYAVYIVRDAGGWGPMLARLHELYGSQAAERTISFLPPLNDATWPFLTILSVQWFFQINADGTGYLAQRMMACRNGREARIAAVVFSWSQVFLRSLIWAVIGVGLLVVYPHAAGAVDAAGFIAGREATYIEGIRDLLPAGIRGLMLVGLIGALASTVDTHLNWGASYWSNDLYKHVLSERILGRRPSHREIVWVARLSNVLILLCALLVMRWLQSIRQAWEVSLLFGAGIGPVLILRWVWSRMNIYSEIAAIACSLIVSLSLIVGQPDLGQHWKLLLAGGSSTLAAVAAALLLPATDRSVLERFFQHVQPPGFWQSGAGGDEAAATAARMRFRRDVQATAAAALSLFGALAGSGLLLFGDRAAAAIGGFSCLAVAGWAVRYWWPALQRS